MRFKISLMSALVVLDHIDKNSSLAKQIESVNSKATTLYLEAPIEQLQNALKSIKVFMNSGAEYNKNAYEYIIKEVGYLADEST